MQASRRTEAALDSELLWQQRRRQPQTRSAKRNSNSISNFPPPFELIIGPWLQAEVSSLSDYYLASVSASERAARWASIERAASALAAV